MVTHIPPFDFDIVCDRCGASITELLRMKGVRPFGHTLDRFLSRLLSEHTVRGWRLNPRNQTVVCQDCALIINKKGDKK